MNISKATQLAWEQFSLFIRLRDSLKTMRNNRQCRCISCGTIKNTTGRGQTQAGHFIPGRTNALLFNEDIVHGQCFRCNIHLKGNWIPYEKAMIEMYGKEKVEAFKRLVNDRVKYSVNELLEIRDKYKAKIEELGGFD